MKTVKICGAERDAAHMRAVLADVAKIRDGVGDTSIFDRAERWSKP